VRPTLLLAAALALPVPCAHAAVSVSATSRSIPDYGGGASTVFSVVATGDQADDELRAPGIYGDFHLALGALVTDPAGAVAGTGCEQVDETSVRCMVPTQQIGNATVAVALDGGAGNDTLHASEVAGNLVGGEGDDVLDAAGITSGVLDGGGGADRLIGPPRDQEPHGGVTFDGGPGPDVMLGYGSVTYADRTRPVHVDLRKSGPVQGEAGERDTIERARIVYGGHGDDELTAGPGRDALSGGPGADVLRRLGRGDSAAERDGFADDVRCDGRGAVIRVDGPDLVLGCGRAAVRRRGVARPRIIGLGAVHAQDESGRWVNMQIGCPDDMRSGCRIAVRAEDPVGVVSRGVFVVKAGKQRLRREIRLDPRTTRRAIRRGRVELTLRITTRDGAGRTIRLRRTYDRVLHSRR
jgi:hypothetical protein